MDKKEMLSKVGRYEFLAEPFHCDFSGRLTMGHLGNHLLNAADFHSNDRGYGMTTLTLINKTWVLSRLAIEMTKMPKAYDHFFVETWVEGAMKYFTSRNFCVSDGDGKVYGYGRSIWAMIDTVTRQPADILSVQDGRIVDYIETEKPCPIEKISRVKMGPQTELLRTIDTYYSDVDMNGHVNSVKYIEHVLDLFPIDYLKESRLERLDIAYVMESHQGDRLSFYREDLGKGQFQIQITKQASDGDENVEVCRCNLYFVKV